MVVFHRCGLEIVAAVGVTSTVAPAAIVLPVLVIVVTVAPVSSLMVTETSAVCEVALSLLTRTRTERLAEALVTFDGVT